MKTQRLTRVPGMGVHFDAGSFARTYPARSPADPRLATAHDVRRAWSETPRPGAIETEQGCFSNRKQSLALSLLPRILFMKIMRLSAPVLVLVGTLPVTSSAILRELALAA